MNITDYMVGASDGDVGIRTAAPDDGKELDVSGDIECTSLNQTSDVRFKKNIVSLPDGQLDKIKMLRGVKYNLRNDLCFLKGRIVSPDTVIVVEDSIRMVKDSLGNDIEVVIKGSTYTPKFDYLNGSDGPQIGFIAQEVESIYPELVETNEHGYKSMGYSRLIPILVEGMKEQQAMIEDLEARLAALEK